MVQYILNVSVIWLACLLLFDFLLRKESFHQFNRLFLIFSLIIGMLLPLANLKNVLPENTHTLISPKSQVYKIKKAIEFEQVEEITTHLVSDSNKVRHPLWVVYLAGFFIGVILMGNEAFKLLQLYLNGRKSVDLGCTIVETGKDYGPFSFFHIVFVRSRQDFNEVQWNLLLTHEKEHCRQLHLVDNLIMLFLRILCWFNPLPHIYYKRLRMLHEFQADQVAASNTLEYGTFLLEQNLLQGAPSLTHSINYSPLKTRIIMLTRTKSKRIKLLKYLTIIPLLLFLTVLCTQTSISGGISQQTRKVNFKGNIIEFGEIKVVPYEYRELLKKQQSIFLNATIPDSVPIKDWASEEVHMERVLKDIVPVTINGKHIFGKEPEYVFSKENMKYVTPVVKESGLDVETHLFKQLQEELNLLEDGNYTLRADGLIIDEKGHVAYYEHEGIDIYGGPDDKKPILHDAILERIHQKMVTVLDKPLLFKPAIKDGKPINVRIVLSSYIVKVKNHKAILAERPGC